MAKQIIAWCDACLEADPESQEPATTTAPMVLDTSAKGAKPRTIDLCDRHHKELVVPLIDALNAWGVSLQPSMVGRQPVGLAQPAPGVRTTTGDRSHRAKDSGGRKFPKPGTKVWGPFKCRVKGCTQRAPSINLDAFHQHLHARHAITPAEYVERYGKPGPGRPDIPHQRDRLNGVWKCYEPGCDFVVTEEDTRSPSYSLSRHLNATGHPDPDVAAQGL